MRLSFASGDVPDPPKRPTERRLDEEALSRMDDEGGSTEPAVNPPGAARKAAPGR
jgi:hypothetical protein